MMERIVIIGNIIGFSGIIFQSAVFWSWFWLREDFLMDIGFYGVFLFLPIIAISIYFVSCAALTRPDLKKKGLLSLGLLTLNLAFLVMHGVLAELVLRRTYIIFNNRSGHELREVIVSGSLWYHTWNRIGAGGIRFVHFYPEAEGIYEIGFTMGNERKTFSIYACPGDMFRIRIYSDTVLVTVKTQ